MTERNKAANLGRDTPTTTTQSVDECEESSRSGGLIATFGNHLQ